MKLALFFFLSLVLHAAAFLVPISLNGRSTDRAITVTILPIESVNEQSGGGHAAKYRIASRKSVNALSNERPGDSTPSSIPAALEKLPVENPAVVADQSVTSITAVSMLGISNRTGDSSASGAGSGGNNFAAEKSGTGTGDGAITDRRLGRTATSLSRPTVGGRAAAGGSGESLRLSSADSVGR